MTVDSCIYSNPFVCLGTLPFDRHDWFVDRSGREVRYVIDFYFDESKAGTPEAFHVDARPALDSVASVIERAKMGVRNQDEPIHICSHLGCRFMCGAHVLDSRARLCRRFVCEQKECGTKLPFA